MPSNQCFDCKVYGYIALRMKDGSAGAPYPLVQRRCCFGSRSCCSIRLNASAALQEHPQIQIDENDNVWFETTIQSNAVNASEAARVDRVLLLNGDKFTIGEREFVFEKIGHSAADPLDPAANFSNNPPGGSKLNECKGTLAVEQCASLALDFELCGDEEVVFYPPKTSAPATAGTARSKLASAAYANCHDSTPSDNGYYPAFLFTVLVFSVALACFHTHLVLAAASTITVTFDETAHVGAGVTFWKYKDFRLNPENGVLPQLIAGAGIMWGRPGVQYTVPTFQQQAWLYSDCWSIGFQLLHGSGNNLAHILHDGRRGIAVRSSAFTHLLRWCCCSCCSCRCCIIFSPAMLFSSFCPQICSGVAVFATGIIAFFAFVSISPSRGATSFAASAISAFAACVLCALDPSLIAHGGLMTSDTVLTLFWLVSPVLLWHAIVTAASPIKPETSKQMNCTSRPSITRRAASFLLIISYLVITGAVTGLLVASKHSGVLIAPVLIAFLFLLIRFYARELGILAAFAFALRALAALFIVTCAALVTFWGCYFFRFSAFADGEVGHSEQWLALWKNVDYLPGDGLVKQVLLLLRRFDALPQAFQYGFAYAYKSAQARNAFLIGAHSAGGWKSFFPIAVALKTPAAALAMLALSTLLLLARVVFRLRISPKALTSGIVRPSLFPALIVPFLLYWAVAIHTNLNIGHRHMLPSYPPMFIFSSYCLFLPLVAPPGPPLVRFCVRAVALCLAAACLAALVWEVRPHLLAPIPFFNVFVGGPSNGYKYLVDSSLDWGQDLPRFSTQTIISCMLSRRHYILTTRRRFGE